MSTVTATVCASAFIILNRQLDKIEKRAVVHRFDRDAMLANLQAIKTHREGIENICRNLAQLAESEEQRIITHKAGLLDKQRAKAKGDDSAPEDGEGGETPAPDTESPKRKKKSKKA